MKLPLGMNPDAIAKKLLLGDFGQGLSEWFNRHQKGNKWLMETLNQTEYPVKAVSTQQLYDSVQGEKGAAGLLFILQLAAQQQADIIRSVQAAIKRGQEAPAPAAMKVPEFPASSCCKAGVTQVQRGSDPAVTTCAKCGEPCQLAERDAPPAAAEAASAEASMARAAEEAEEAPAER